MLISCDEYTPKPKGHLRITRDTTGATQLYNPSFSFLYPSDSHIEYIKPEEKSGVWFNISYPQYKAVIYCTYVPLRNNLSQMLDDSYRLAYSHASKAEGISQSLFADSAHHTFATIYDIKGSVASPIQFYVTDSISNFMRGSLYFNDAVQSDSISPVVTFIKEDIVRLIESLKWTNSKSSPK